MSEVVRFRLPDKSFPSLRHPSFAGRSLAERMRSTTFALFGLAAAAGLALVAIFAQPGGPLLSPAPLPSEPSSSVGKAEALAAPLVPKFARHPLVLRHSVAGPSGAGSQGGSVGHGGGSNGSPTTGTVGAPQPAGSPASGGGEAGGNGGAPETTPPPQPAPEATTSPPAPAPESVPVDSPAPEKAPPVHVSLPGHSNSGHSGGGKGVAATVHAVVSPPPPSPLPVEIPAVGPGSSGPGNSDNGHGHGHGK